MRFILMISVYRASTIAQPKHRFVHWDWRLLVNIEFYSSKKYRFSVDTNVVCHRGIFHWYQSEFATNRCFLVTDRRTFKDRRDVWAEEKKAAELARERPKAKIRHNTPPPEENPLRKNKPAGGSASSAPHSSSNNHDEAEEDLVSVSIVFMVNCCTYPTMFVSSLLHLLKKKKRQQKKKSNQPLSKKKQPKQKKKRKKRKRNEQIDKY
jgi:hypothetical protein